MILSELQRIQTIELKAHFLFHFALQLSKIRPRKPPGFWIVSSFSKTASKPSPAPETFSVNLHGIDHFPNCEKLLPLSEAFAFLNQRGTFMHHFLSAVKNFFLNFLFFFEKLSFP